MPMWHHISPMSTPTLRWTGSTDRKGRATDMTIDSAMAALAAIIFIGPLLALAVAAVRFGADSRPGVGDPDRRPWLIGH